jgi:hypothetical protein
MVERFELIATTGKNAKTPEISQFRSANPPIFLKLKYINNGIFIYF